MRVGSLVPGPPLPPTRIGLPAGGGDEGLMEATSNSIFGPSDCARPAPQARSVRSAPAITRVMSGLLSTFDAVCSRNVPGLAWIFFDIVFLVRLTVLWTMLPALVHVCSAATCEDLAALTLPNTTITSAGMVAADANGAPAFCRVAATLKPTSDSEIKIEVWLPATGWNGKYQAVGNGGWSGSINSQRHDCRRCGAATPPVPPTPGTPAAAPVSRWDIPKS